MAKITFDQAKAELALLEESIKIYQQAGAPVLKMVQDRYDYLMKVISGNASAQVADVFNESIGSVINAEGNEGLLESITKAVGTKVKLTVSIVDGKVKFEAAGTSGGGGGNAGATGITRTATPFNHWVVTKNSDGSKAEFESAADAVKHVLNGGSNPMGLPASFGAGNSMVRVLTTYLPKYEAFKAEYVVEGSYVEKAKAPVAPTATEAPAIGEGQE